MTNSSDVEGWESLSSDDKQMIINKIGSEFQETSSAKAAGKPSNSADDKFCEFQRIVGKIAGEPSYTFKSQILQKFLTTVKVLLKFQKIDGYSFLLFTGNWFEIRRERRAVAAFSDPERAKTHLQLARQADSKNIHDNIQSRPARNVR